MNFGLIRKSSSRNEANGRNRRGSSSGRTGGGDSSSPSCLRVVFTSGFVGGRFVVDRLVGAMSGRRVEGVVCGLTEGLLLCAVLTAGSDTGVSRPFTRGATGFGVRWPASCCRSSCGPCRSASRRCAFAESVDRLSGVCTVFAGATTFWLSPSSERSAALEAAS